MSIITSLIIPKIYLAQAAPPPAGVNAGSLPQGAPSLDDNLDGFDSRTWERANGYGNVAPFNNGWRADHATFQNGVMTLQLDNNNCPQACAAKPYASAEYRSRKTYGYGLLEGRFKAAKGDGLVSSLFTFYAPRRNNYKFNDEIDVEILGKDTTQMQINYYNDATTNKDHPDGQLHKMVPLGFDASEGFHNYAILWAPKYISWYVDGRLVHTETGKRGALPTKPGQIMANLWPGIGVDSWLRPFNYSGPVTAEYDWIRFTPAANLSIPETMPATVSATPPGFDNTIISPRDLIAENKDKITKIETRITKNDQDLELERKHEDSDKSTLKAYTNFSDRLVRWLIQRENGNPDDSLLNASLRYRGAASPFWTTKIASIIISGNPTEPQVNFLRAFGYLNGNEVKPPLSKETRYRILKKVYDDYPEVPVKLFQKEEKTSPLLRAEIEFQLALLAPAEEGKEGRKDYLARALKNSGQSQNISAAVRQLLDYIKKSPNGPQMIAGEINHSLSKAEVLQAQILLLSKEPDILKGFALLSQAYQHLKNGTQWCGGLDYLEIKRFAAEALIRMGLLVKTHEKEIDLTADPIFLELREWEQAIYGQVSPASYQTYFRAAQALIAGTDDSVVGWETRYNQEPDVKTEPAWLKQIAIFSRIWTAIAVTVEAGEVKTADPIKKAEQQTKMLTGAAETFSEILRAPAGLLDAETLADVKCNLAKNLTQQAYIQLDSDNQDRALSLLQEAADLLTQAEKAGSQETKDEAVIWLAKISLSEAGTNRSGDASPELKKAAGLIQSVLPPAADRLKNSQLSAAHQTYAEILVGLKDFNAARQEFTAALAADKNNYEAMAGLADIHNWQGNYSEAIDIYDVIGKNSPRLKLRAELGRLEAEMRGDQGYTPGKIDDLEKLIERIKKAELRGSSLIPRGIASLIEAYSAGKDASGHKYFQKIIALATRVLNNQAGFTPTARLQAVLYLRWAEAVSWSHDDKKAVMIERAETVLRSIPPEIRDLIERDKELNLSYQLLTKELTMRKTKEGQAFADPLFKEAILKSEDPNLISRFVNDQIEAQTLQAADSHEFKPLIVFLVGYLSDDNQDMERIGKIFKDKDTKKFGFQKLRLQLRWRLADARLWDEQYDAALADYQALLKAEPLPAGESDPIKAWAQFGLGEIHRYGPDKLQDYGTAEKNYFEAKRIAEALPERSDDKDKLMFRVYLGLAKLKEMQKDRAAAWDYLMLADYWAKRLDEPEPESVEEFDSSYAELAPYERSSINMKAGTFRGADGRSEAQFLTRFELKTWRPLHLTLDLQDDMGDSTALYSAFPGLKALLGPWTLEAQGKLGTTGHGDNSLYYRRPELKLSAFYWDDSLVGGLAVNVNSLAHFSLTDPLNSAFGELMYNNAGSATSALGKGLLLGAKLNYYNFAYLGDFQPRFSVSLGGREEYKVNRWLKLYGEAGWLMYSSQQGAPGHQWTDWKFNGWEASAGLLFSVGRHFNFNVGCAYQYTPEYPIETCTAGLIGTR